MVNPKDKDYSGNIVVARFKKVVTPFGTSGHIPVGKEFVGDEAEIQIRRKYFICNGCHETITGKDNFSPNPNLCISCYKENEAMKNNKCKSCGGPNPIKELWAQCQKCWDKSLEENEKWNKAHGKPMMDFEEIKGGVIKKK